MKHEAFPNKGNSGRELFLELRAKMDTLWKHRVDIEAALSHGNDSHTFDDIALRVMRGDLAMYPLPNSVVLMEYTQYPQHSTYHGYIAAGDLKEIIALQDKLLGDAKRLGCKYMSIAGRKGWEPTLRKLGWSHQLSIMTRSVDDG